MQVGLIVAGYGVIQVAYSFGLKQVVIIDVMTLATLFILRVIAGAEAIDTVASEWLLLCTGALASFLGFTKRRQEAVSELHEGASSRPVLEHYSLPFLDQMVAMVTTATVITYAIYTVYSPLIGSRMMLTIPPVVYGIFRYLYLIYDRSDDRSTAAIVARSRISSAAGRAPAPMISETTAQAERIVGNAASIVRISSGLRLRRTVISVAMPKVEGSPGSSASRWNIVPLGFVIPGAPRRLMSSSL